MISLLEKLIFVEALNLDSNYTFSGIYFASSVLYGGIVEEILLRYGFMTLIVWLASKIVKSTEGKGIYIFGIIFAALFFAIGHLPATNQMLGLDAMTISRALVLNLLPGIGFGYLYWRFGLIYAMVGHTSTHVINQLILLPLLFS